VAFGDVIFLGLPYVLNCTLRPIAVVVEVFFSYMKNGTSCVCGGGQGLNLDLVFWVYLRVERWRGCL